jgi:hypothetical protein
MALRCNSGCPRAPRASLSTLSPHLTVQAPHYYASTATFTTTSTDTSATTIPFLGHTAGTAINAFGTRTIQLFERVIISTKLEAMSLNFPHLDNNSIHNIEQIYRDVLELCRCDHVLMYVINRIERITMNPIRSGLYDNKVRRQAMRLVLLQISNGQTEHLITALLEWPRIEMAYFLSEIILCLPSEWTG